MPRKPNSALTIRLLDHLQKAGKKASTAKTYASLLSSLGEKILRNDPEQLPEVPFFEDYLDLWQTRPNVVINFIGDHIPNEHSKATTFAALFAVTENPDYYQQMMSSSGRVTATYKQQEQTEKQAAQTLTMEKIKEIHNHWMDAFAKSPGPNTMTNALITGLMSGVYEGTPPRRLLDYAEMKVRRYEPEADNYVFQRDNGNHVMVFHMYKTADADRKRGAAVPILPFPEPLLPVLSYRISRFEPDHMLLTDRLRHFTPTNLHRRLKQLFGCSVDMLRQVFITDMHRNTPALLRMEQTANDMGHSVQAQLQFYTKKNDAVTNNPGLVLSFGFC